MKFSSFLWGLATYLLAQTTFCVLLGLGLWRIVVLDLAAIFLAQAIYLVVIVAMVRAEKARRAAATGCGESGPATDRDGLEEYDPFHP